jgi:hypothetical protein
MSRLQLLQMYIYIYIYTVLFYHDKNERCKFRRLCETHIQKRGEDCENADQITRSVEIAKSEIHIQNHVRDTHTEENMIEPQSHTPNEMKF